MPPSPQVPCHPYFKLRRLTPRIQIGPQAADAMERAESLRRLQLAHGPRRRGRHRHRRTRRRLGAVRHGSVLQIHQPARPADHRRLRGRHSRTAPIRITGSNSDPDYEVALDIEVAGAAYYAATGKPATIRMYWSQDIATAVQKAANDGCDVCSISWGADEATWGTTAARRWNPPQLLPPTSAWSFSAHPATTTPATAALLPPMSMPRRPARTS